MLTAWCERKLTVIFLSNLAIRSQFCNRGIQRRGFLQGSVLPNGRAAQAVASSMIQQK
jgi:hypothetical protein